MISTNMISCAGKIDQIGGEISQMSTISQILRRTRLWFSSITKKCQSFDQRQIIERRSRPGSDLVSGKKWLKTLIQLDFHGGLTETTWIQAQVLWREKLLSRLPSSQDCSEDTKKQYDTKLQKYNWQNLHVTYNSKLLSWLSIRNNWYVRRFKISTWPPTWKPSCQHCSSRLIHPILQLYLFESATLFK